VQEQQETFPEVLFMTWITRPDVCNWQVLMARGGGAPDDLVQQLESCADCQDTLENLAAKLTLWDDAAQGLGREWHAAAQEPTLRHTVECLKNRRVSFSRSADKLMMLGSQRPSPQRT
jgi:hypothetical protein